MIQKINSSDKKLVSSLLCFLEDFGKSDSDSDLDTNSISDFYFTSDNQRIYVTNIGQLKQFLRESVGSYFLHEDGDCKGIALIWKSVGGEKTRLYIKAISDSPKIAEDLLTQIFWDFPNESNLFAKLKRNNKILSAFYRKGFEFAGGRGSEILLKRNSKFWKDNFRIDKEAQGEEDG